MKEITKFLVGALILVTLIGIVSMSQGTDEKIGETPVNKASSAINNAGAVEAKAVETPIQGQNEKSVTITDSAGRTVTIYKPVKRILPTDYRTTEALLAIGARDMIIAVDKTFHDRMPEFGLKDLPEASEHAKIVNSEEILRLKPDLVILPISQAKTAEEAAKQLPNIPVIVMGLTARGIQVSELKTMGMLLGKEKEAGELIDWIQKYDGIVEERTKGMKPEEMPTFYYEYTSDDKKWWTINPGDPSAGQVAEGCGGRNIAGELKGTTVQVDPEWVIKQNPDVMFADLMKGFETGPGKTEADVEKKLAQILADRPGFGSVNAVKNKKVYVIDRDLISGPRGIIGHSYFAKWLHPDLFKDIHPEEMNKEYLKKFFNIELEGTWAYPLPE